MKGRRIVDAALLVLATVLPAVSSANGTATLTVKVTGAEPGKGQVVFALFTSREKFLREPHITSTLPIDSGGRAVFTVPRLEPGIYAVSIYHDEDSNGKLNTGLFGIPTELVGFSNNAKSLFGPPSFGKAAFPVSGHQTIEIRLGKAKD